MHTFSYGPCPQVYIVHGLWIEYVHTPFVRGWWRSIHQRSAERPSPFVGLASLPPSFNRQRRSLTASARSSLQVFWEPSRSSMMGSPSERLTDQAGRAATVREEAVALRVCRPIIRVRAEDGSRTCKGGSRALYIVASLSA